MTTGGADDREAGLLGRVFRNAGVLLGGKAANAVLSLGALAVAARALGVEALGHLVLIHAFTQAVGEIAKFQSWQAVIRYGAPALEADDRPALRRLVRLTAGLDAISAVLGAAACVLLVWLVGPRLGWPEALSLPAAAFATSVIFMVTATPTGVLRLLGRFDALSVNSALGSLVRLVGGAAAWAMGGGIGAFLVAWYVSVAVPGVFLILAAWRTLGRARLTEGISEQPGRRASDAFPRFWPFVWSTNANTSVDLAFSHLGVLVVGALLGPAPAALFRVAKQVADGVAKPARLLVPAIYPELGRLAARGDAVALRRLMVRACLIAGGVVTALLACIAVIGEPLLMLIGGEAFAEGYGLMLWLVAAGVVGVWVFPVEPYLISAGRAGSVLIARLVVAAIYLPLLVWGLGEAGLIAAGYARLGAAILLAALLLLRARAALRERPASP